MTENPVRNIFNNSEESDNLLFKLYKKYGLNMDDMSDEVLHDFTLMQYAETEAEALQNAFNRGLTTIETIRLITEARSRIEEELSKSKRSENITSLSQ